MELSQLIARLTDCSGALLVQERDIVYKFQTLHAQSIVYGLEKCQVVKFTMIFNIHTNIITVKIMVNKISHTIIIV